MANVISDVAGETGQKILRAIVAGERDGLALAKLRNARIRASEDEIAKSLQGNWRAEHLFALKQALDAFDFCGALLHKSKAERGDPNPRRNYARAATDAVIGRPICVKRLSSATRTCNSTT